ncbi:MAG TPA: hypothetical protein DIW81_22810, partial [Planctomycetaceae bacterium]|nr:hypothetical protein [Planctomycetaceae bacterium]
SGSVAINAGDNTKALDENAEALTSDQRGSGFDRINQTTVDVGAYEYTPARTFVVDTLLDEAANGSGVTDGMLSLREAIEAANTNMAFGDALAGSGDETDIITFSSSLSGMTILLDDQQLTISDDLIINGLGADKLEINADVDSRIFEVQAGATVEMSGLELSRGRSNGAGGAIYNQGNLYLRDMEFDGNDSFGDGGAIYHTGENLTINSSLFDNNAAFEGRGGAIAATTDYEIYNSTFRSNYAAVIFSTPSQGGAIFSDTSSATIVNSTFVNNFVGDNLAANDGGAIYVKSGTLLLNNTLIAGSKRGTVANEIFGTVTGSNNLIADAATSGGLSDGVDGNIVGVNGSGTRDINTILDPVLRDNGGSTRTHALIFNSLAINAGSNALAVDENSATLTTDQRGTGFDRILGDTVDIGAYESTSITNGEVIIRIDIAPSSLGYGIPGQDNATGNGFILYSLQSVQQRFAGAVVANGAEHFVAVRFVNNQWQYANNDVWVNFRPTTGDRLIASVNFDSSQVQMLQGSTGSVNGINQGYIAGDLTITPNQWRNAPNAGEFGITGTYFTLELTAIRIDIAPSSLGYGIPGQDNATGNGFILYSQQSVQQRFAGAVVANGAEHFVVVRFIDNQWQYANNDIWVNFTPTAGDRLIASVNFDSSQVQMLEGSTGSVNGINQGYIEGDLTITPNQWRDRPNAGEFGITGTYFTLELTTIRIDIAPSSLGYGIPGQDNAIGNGFILYSQQNVQQRFAGAVVSNGAEHFVVVRFIDNQWQYANNDVWVDFTPTTGDRLIASVNFDSSQVQMLQGSTGSFNGINQGYLAGNLTITPNQWRNTYNAGEFGITGTYFILELPTIRIDIAPSSLGYGIPGQDNATGNGFILYSQQSVQQRFAGAVVANGAEHFLAVRFVNYQWQYANNDVWVNFTPNTEDRLIAAVNFDSSHVQMLLGSSGSMNGIYQGYLEGDLTITPNQWRDRPNAGEFGISGTYFTFE